MENDNTKIDTKIVAPRTAFTILGVASVVGLTVFIGGGLLIDFLTVSFFPDLLSYSAYGFLLTNISLVFFTIPIMFAILKLLPTARVTQTTSLSFFRLFKYFLMIFFPAIMISGISNIIMMFFSVLKGEEIVNPIADTMLSGNPIWSVLFIVILAPFVEEFLFRGIIMSKLRPYGNGVAIFAPAFIFALFHGNLFQIFYAFGIGAFMGCIVAKTGKLRHSIIIHMIFNACGAVFPILLISQNSVVMVISTLIYIALMITSLIFFILAICKKEFPFTRNDLIKKGYCKAFFVNPGIILFILAAIGLIVYQMLM